MSSMAEAVAVSRPRWLYGPASDLLLGCGGMYVAIFVALVIAGAQALRWAPQGLLPLVLLFAAVPHYGATLVRVYDRREDRTRYRFFAIWASLLVWGLFVAGVYSLTLGSWLVTVFLTWSPWHYSGQNYGIGLMMLGRRGVRVTPTAKRFVYASFFLSWILVVLGMHGAISSGTYTPTPVSLGESAYMFKPLGIPLSILGPLLGLTAAGYFVSVVGSAVLLRREAPWRDLSPWIGVVLLQALWFSIPVISRATTLFETVVPIGERYQEYTLLWMALGHSLQYLWVTTYYANRTKTDTQRVRYFGKVFLVGGATFAIPLFLFSPDVLGVYAWDAGLALLISAAVNIHHFVLDGAIWKLRDGRIARVLLRSPQAEPDAGLAPSLPLRRRSWIRPVIYAAGAAYAIFYVVGVWEIEFGFRRALERMDVDRMRVAARRLSRVGHDNPALRYNLGVLSMRGGDPVSAEHELRRSLELGPNALSWLALGQLYQGEKRWQDALDAYARARDIAPDNVPALVQSANIWMRLGEHERAEQALVAAVGLAPQRADLQETLRRVREARRANGRG
jgi:Tetratricopeptide repeat